MKTNDFNVLVVDNNVLFAKCVVDYLNLNNISADFASNADEAMLIMSKKKYQVVLIELRLPMINGMSLMKTIHMRNPLLTTVMMAGYATESQVKEVLSSGALDFIFKPFHMEMFKQIIEIIKLRNSRLNESDIQLV